jgi:hypothetical protein
MSPILMTSWYSVLYLICTVTDPISQVFRVVAAYLIEFFEHGEDDDDGEGADHGGGGLWREREASQDRDDKEVDIGCALKLIQKGQWRPRDEGVLGRSDGV